MRTGRGREVRAVVACDPNGVLKITVGKRTESWEELVRKSKQRFAEVHGVCTNKLPGRNASS